MPEVRGKEKIGQKFAQGVKAGVSAYKEGVARPRRDWQSATLAAEEAYDRGVSDAVAERRFSKGVSEVSTAEWQRQATTLGARNFGPGAAAAAEKYARRVRPYLDIIESVELGEKVPGDVEGNIDRRLLPIARALSDAKRGK